MAKMLKGEELRKRADQLGVSQDETYDYRGTQSEPELQRRVMEAERHIREGSLWMIALFSAIASAISAATALVALFIKA